MTKQILNQLRDDDEQDGPTAKYDGSSKGYRRWERAVLNVLRSVGVRWAAYYMKLPKAKAFSTKECCRAYSKSTLTLLYNVLIATLSPSIVPTYANDACQPATRRT